MKSTRHELPTAVWKPERCPFAVEYVPQVLDDIRLAVVDAFYSLPRGGAEIGGLLLGSHAVTPGTRLPAKVTISGYLPLDCEHAFGPSFSLSPKDHSGFREGIAAAQREGKQVAGWYHSHTRSAIHLTAADLEIYDLYFREPWQVALVLKPHTFEPTRCGFFFREPDGNVYSSSSHEEFSLAPLAMRPAPSVHSAAAPAASARRPVLTMDQVIQAGRESAAAAERASAADAAMAAPQSAATPSPAPERDSAAQKAKEERKAVPARAGVPVSPQAADAKPEWRPGEETGERGIVFAEEPEDSGQSRAWLYWLVAAALVVSITYNTRERWMGSPDAAAVAAGSSTPTGQPARRASLTPFPAPAVQHPAPPAATSTLSLLVSQVDGELQIRWDRTAAAIERAVKGTLEITDGKAKQSVSLSPAQLLAGSFGYARRSERVQTRLTIQESDGSKVSDLTSFFGRMPERKAPAEDPQVRRQRDDLQNETSRLKSELSAEVERRHKLEQSLEQLKQRVNGPQKRRPGNLSIDPLE